MSLGAGERLGPYEVLASIGAGGMGEVYKARDTRLDRIVALKVSKSEFSERFEREARAVAALNHPNICTLHDVGPNYLVMEYIEGTLLKGPLPLDEALKCATQICEALDAAHKKNITHRDLKPANILVTKAGIKLLDFGLAKVGPVIKTDEATMTMALTGKGQILGTLLYMSPEQINGEEADARSDIFSFGLILYEMLTGKRAFGGATPASVIAAILERPTPSVSDVAPAALDRVLKRCLEKDPENRWQSARDLKAALELATAGVGTTEIPKATHARSPFGWMLFGATAVALAALAFVHFREQPPVAELTRFQIPLPANQTFPNPVAPQEVSPDGRTLAFDAAGADGKRHLWIRSFDSLEARLLQGIEIASTDAFFWSSDSRFLAFQSSDNKLKKVDVSGGPAQTLCDAAGVVGGSWSRDGVILFGGSVIMRVSDEGGTPTALTALDPARQEFGHAHPRLLPDGRHFLYFRYSMTPGNSGIYVGAIDAKPSQQSSKPLVVNPAFPEYYVPSGNSSTGYLLFYREGTVLAQVFNPNTLELSGGPIPVAEQVEGFQNFIGFFSASTNGVLIYVGGNGNPGGNTQLTWFDRQGKNLGTVGEPATFLDVALFKDGKQAAVSRLDSPSAGLKAHLWLLDLTRGGASTRFTSGAYLEQSPVWSPDGSSIVFESTRDGSSNLYRKLTSGIKDEELLLKSDEPKIPSSLSPDGRYLLYSAAAAKTKLHVWILTMDESHRSMPFQATEFTEFGAKFSPDGRWIAYGSDESGRQEVYVREFLLGADGKPEATRKYQVSNGGGVSPYWRDDGKAVIYGSLDRRTGMLAEITAFRPDFQTLPAKALGQLPAGVNAVDITTDGKRVLVTVPVGQSGPQQFTVVQNWPAGLKK